MEQYQHLGPYLNPIYKYLSEANPLKTRDNASLFPAAKHLFPHLLPTPPAVVSFQPSPPHLAPSGTPCSPLPLQEQALLGQVLAAGKIVYQRFQGDVATLGNDQLGKQCFSLPTIERVRESDSNPSLACSQLNTDQLSFQSRFESGNLSLASKVQNCYLLLLQKDFNSKGHTQWFYFRVRSAVSKEFEFKILNFCKKDSLFNKGMQPVGFSSKSKTWERVGTNVSYSPLRFQTSVGKLHSLSFKYQFEAGEQVYFAYSYPYTYTHLKSRLSKWAREHSQLVHLRSYGHSLLGNPCYLLTITAPGLKKKPHIYITARVHPGETVSSFVCEGLVQYLLSKCDQAQLLLNSYVFKVFPMLNVDGVVHGNSRCSLAGCDLNRQWRNPVKKLHPQIFPIKQLLLQSNSSRSTQLVIDLHGHSRKKDFFVYGCGVENSLKPRQFAFMLAKSSPLFSYSSCSFTVEKDKEGTARVVLFQELSLPFVYTLEGSFFSVSKSKTQITPKQYCEMGQHLGLAILSYFGYQKTFKVLMRHNGDGAPEGLISKDVLAALRLRAESRSPKRSEGSDSEPSLGNLSQQELHQLLEEKKQQKREDRKPKAGPKIQVQSETQLISARKERVVVSSVVKPVVRRQERVEPELLCLKPACLKGSRKEKIKYLSELVQQACDLNYTSVIFPSVLKEYYSSSKKTKESMFDFGRVLSHLDKNKHARVRSKSRY